MKVHDLDQMNIKHDLGPCTCREHVQLATATAQLAEARELLDENLHWIHCGCQLGHSEYCTVIADRKRIVDFLDKTTRDEQTEAEPKSPQKNQPESH